MANVSTIYDVRVKYRLDDQASRPMKGIGKRANSLSKSLKRLVAIGVAGFGFKSLVKHTIGFNRELDSTKKSLATVIQLMDKDTSTRAEGLTKSSMLMAQLREDAKQSAGTFQEMTDFAKQIAPPVLAAGASMEELRELTKGSVVAASAFGIRADVAALDIRQALGKGLNKRDPFGSMLLDSIGMTTDAFNQLDKVSRMKTLQKAFDQPAIRAAAKEYQTSFEGTFSTFKSSLQEFGGKVGSKLFAKLTTELIKVNKWFTANSARVDDFASSLADGMVTAFNVAKKIFGFIFEHKDLLMTLAKAMLISKAASFMAGPFLGFGTQLSASEGKLGKFGGALSKAGVALQAFGAGFAIGTVIDKWTGASDKLSTALNDHVSGLLGIPAFSSGIHVNTGGIDMSTPEGKALVAEKKAAAIRAEGDRRAAKARKAGVEGVRGLMSPDRMESIERSKFKNTLREAFALEANAKKIRQTSSIEKIINTQETKRVEEARMKVISQGIVKFLFDMAPDRMFQFGGTEGGFNMLDPNSIFDVPTASTAETKDKKNNVRIGKIVMQIESNDPDRLALGMEGLFSDLAKNGAQASTVLREG